MQIWLHQHAKMDDPNLWGLSYNYRSSVHNLKKGEGCTIYRTLGLDQTLRSKLSLYCGGLHRNATQSTLKKSNTIQWIGQSDEWWSTNIDLKTLILARQRSGAQPTTHNERAWPAMTKMLDANLIVHKEVKKGRSFAFMPPGWSGVH